MKRLRVLVLTGITACSICMMTGCGNTKTDTVNTQTEEIISTENNTLPDESVIEQTPNTQNPGAQDLDNAGQHMQDAGEDVIDGLENTGDAIKDSVEGVGDKINPNSTTDTRVNDTTNTTNETNNAGTTTAP